MKRYPLLIVAAVMACSGATSTSTSSTLNKSAKRGIAYDLAAPADLAALSPGVSWWYNWSPYPNTAVPANYATQYEMQFEPMLWTFNFTVSGMQTHGYILVLNEPNIVTQANVTPQQAAQMWPQFEVLASQTGANIRGPGDDVGHHDWVRGSRGVARRVLRGEAANNGRQPRIDYLAFHWYDYGLSAQLDRLTKYGKPFWVTEFANWHSQNDGAEINTLAKQEAQMTDMVATCESRSDVFRYAWYTGRLSPDPHYTSLLGATGQLTDLGKLYLSLPVQ
jgi:hypothetical protein